MRGGAPVDASAKSLLARAHARRVIFSRGNGPFEALRAETSGRCFVYVFEAAGHTLRVGRSNRARENRLAHHLDTGYRLFPGYPHYYDFFRALLGHAVTVKWLDCDPADLYKVEGLLRRALDPLWERLMRERRARPRVDFYKPVRAILEPAQRLRR